MECAAAYLFSVRPDGSVSTEDAATCASAGGEVEIYLNGFVYDASGEDLVEGFLRGGPGFVRDLDGSFVLFVRDRRSEHHALHVLTDRVNSKKAFLAREGRAWTITNDLERLPKERHRVSPRGVACYVANGSMLNYLTVFEGVTIARRAHVYEFSRGDVRQREYFGLQFEYDDAPAADRWDERQEQLAEIVLATVAKSARACGDEILVSLSAGYDARSILGLLRRRIGFPGTIETLTYAPQAFPAKGSDAELSAKIAADLGCRHHGMRSYRGGFLSFLSRNAIDSRCVAYSCDELDAIEALASVKRYDGVFAGDEWFGRLDVPVKTDIEILDSVSISGSWGIEWLRPILDSGRYTTLRDALDELMAEIIGATSRMRAAHDKKDFLYLEQRVNHVNLTWREYFTGKLGAVHNPYLDGSLLEFYQTTSPAMRIEKQLFIQTITAMLPEVFQVPIARDRRSLTGIDLGEEFRREGNRIVDYLRESDSRLTEVIGRGDIIRVVRAVASGEPGILAAGPSVARKGINALRRKSHAADTILSGFLGPRTVKAPSPERIALRLVMLWIYLARDPDRVIG